MISSIDPSVGSEQHLSHCFLVFFFLVFWLTCLVPAFSAVRCFFYGIDVISVWNSCWFQAYVELSYMCLLVLKTKAVSALPLCSMLWRSEEKQPSWEPYESKIVCLIKRDPYHLGQQPSACWRCSVSSTDRCPSSIPNDLFHLPWRRCGATCSCPDLNQRMTFFVERPVVHFCIHSRLQHPHFCGWYSPTILPC